MEPLRIGERKEAKRLLEKCEKKCKQNRKLQMLFLGVHMFKPIV